MDDININCVTNERSVSNKMNECKILMPINKDFLEVFETFMDENQKEKIRANSVRQYVEGVIDLLLKDNIISHLKPNEIYEGINWGRKIKCLHDNYDQNIANSIQEIFRIGGEGSHFNGKVSESELKKITGAAVHIVEDIFVKYFLSSEHKLGCENIFTIFSMLPLKHRIYILEKLLDDPDNACNRNVIDRLSLAYVKNGDNEKATKLLDRALKEKTIDNSFYIHKIKSLNALNKNLEELYKQNADYEKNSVHSKAIIEGDLLVVGLPTSKDVFDTAKAMETFSCWFEEDKSIYPEFINLFFYLMKTDNRGYY